MWILWPKWPLIIDPFAVITSPSNRTAPCSAWIAWASSLLSSSVFIVTKRRTRRFKEAATIARPKRIKTRANRTYSGRLLSELSFCSATMSPNPIVVSVMKQLKDCNVLNVSKLCELLRYSLINWIEIFPVFKSWKSSRATSDRQRAQCGYHTY